METLAVRENGPYKNSAEINKKMGTVAVKENMEHTRIQ